MSIFTRKKTEEKPEATSTSSVRPELTTKAAQVKKTVAKKSAPKKDESKSMKDLYEGGKKTEVKAEDPAVPETDLKKTNKVKEADGQQVETEEKKGKKGLKSRSTIEIVKRGVDIEAEAKKSAKPKKASKKAAKTEPEAEIKKP